MNYRSRWKERKTKLVLAKIVNLFRFRSVHLPFSAKIILLWNIMLFISLLQDWVIKIDTDDHWSSFSSISGNIWFPFLLGILLIFFFIFSTNHKNKLKLHSNISFQNHSLIWIFGLFSIIASLISLSFIYWFLTLSQNIVYGHGSILALTSWVIITIWAYIMRAEFNRSHVEIFVTGSGELKEKISNKNNMTLPF
jgi:hypothetical protein